MHAISLVLACVACAAFGGRMKTTSGQTQYGPLAQHQKSQNAVNALPGSHSLAELEHSQSITRAGVPSSWKWLPVLLLAVGKPADSFTLHDSRLFTGRGHIAPRYSRPEAGNRHDHALNNSNYWDIDADSMGFQTSKSGSGNGSAPENAFRRHGNPMLTGTLGHLRQTPRRFQRWSPAMSAAVIQRPKLELQRVPPAPPPPPRPRGRDGPGGADDGGNIIMGRLSESQAVTLLDDWIARTRVYCTSGQFDNAADAVVAEVHRKSLEQLEGLRSFSEPKTMSKEQLRRQILESDSSEDPSLPVHKMLLALYASDRKTVLALAGGGVHREIQTTQEYLVIKYVSVNPLELCKESSTAALKKLQQGLRFIANGNGYDLLLLEDNGGE